MEHSIDITSAVDPTPLLSQTEIEIYEEIEYGRRANHIKEIKETHGQVESANQIINERFKELENWSSKSTTIFRVNAVLKESNPDAYMPIVVSIGPYHRNKPKLHSMEKYKLLYMWRFLRHAGIDVEYCLRELEKVKNEALKCYEDIEDTDGNFLQMMLVDGCFVVEFIRENCGMCPEEEVAIPVGNGQVCRDLLLIENQLPLVILTKLDDMTKKDDQEPFILMVKKTLLQGLPKMIPASLCRTEGSSHSTEVNHILQVVHMSCYPSKSVVIPCTTLCVPNVWLKYIPCIWLNPHLHIFSLFRTFRTQISSPSKTSSGKEDSFKDMSKDVGELTWIEMMRNATKLSEAGVSFAKVGKIYRLRQLADNIEDNTSLFDIKFENGRMKIPCFEIHDYTESSLRNLIAYEQQSRGVKPTYFSDFVAFMDHLIDTDKDVSLLCHEGIIRNWLGEDKEVADLFNKIGKGVVTDLDDFYYKEECRKVVQHCNKPQNRIWANLRHNYFSSPWVGASTVAAIMLLLFTFAQTVLAFIKK